MSEQPNGGQPDNEVEPTDTGEHSEVEADRIDDTKVGGQDPAVDDDEDDESDGR